MHMEMNFPHHRRSSTTGFLPCSYPALAAKAVARQAMSRTVMALLSQETESRIAHDTIEARMDLLSGKTFYLAPSGAFFPAKARETSDEANYEAPVYRSASENGKDHALDCLNHNTGQSQRGMEV
jgi:hypothetical protein